MGNNLTCNLNSAMTPSKLLPAAVIASRAAHSSTLIFLHGLGDNGSGWSCSLKDIVPSHCKIICPNAPSIPVTLNGGIRMPAWYDIYALGVDAEQDESGLLAAAAEVDKFVAAEIDAGIPANRIVVGGFSQGGSVALYNALTRKHDYAGVIALSTWLPIHTKLLSDTSLITIPKHTPVLQCHGTADFVVPFSMGHATSQVLQDLKLTKCQFKPYQHMGHCSNQQEIEDVQEFLKDVLPSL